MGNMSGSYGSHYTLWQSITQNSQDIANNKSNVTVNMYLSFDGSSYYAYTNNATSGSMTINGSTTNYSIASINFSSGQAKDILLASWTGDIEHNPDGTKTLSVSGSWNTNTSRIGSGSCSASKTLSTIPRASTITCSTANIEEKATITITSASASFVHNVFGTFGNQEFSVASNRAGGTFTWTIPSSFYKQIPDNPRGQGTLHCQTYSGSTLIGTTSILFYVTTSKEKCTPSISGTVLDTNQTTINLTGDANKLIKYKSTAKATISASAKNGASISKKVINGTTVSGNELSIANVSTTSFVFETVDSRGYPNSTPVTPQMIDYVPLTINANFFRPQPTGSEIQLTYSGNYFNDSFGQVHNELALTWDYKEKTSSEWIWGGVWLTPNIEGNKITQQTISLGTNFDYQKDYNFRMAVKDKLNDYYIYQDVSVGMPVFYWGKDFFTVTGKFNANTYFSGVINPQCWYYIGNFELGSQGSYAVLDCYMGDGQNGVASQNTHARILLKQGWTGGTLPIGVTTKFTQNYSSLIKVKIRHITRTNCALYIYLPFNYNDLTYVISGSYSSFGLSNTVLSEEPTTDKESTYYKDFEPVSLYDNSSGTTGTVPLSESAANFSYLEVFFNCGERDSIKIENPDGKSFTMTISQWVDNRKRTFISNASISGAYIGRGEHHFVDSDGYSQEYTGIYITKVIGYR